MGSALLGPPAWAASADGQIAKGPYLTNLSESAVEIRLELDRPVPLAVDVARESSQGEAGTSDGGAVMTVPSGGPSSMRVVHVTGLQPSARYAYVVRAGRSVLGTGHFTTGPRAGDPSPLSFLLYGDDRSDPVAHAAVVRAMSDVPSDFLVNTGDLVEDGASPAAWKSFFDVEGPLLRNRALFVAIGNHELYNDAAGAQFAQFFGFPGGDEPRIYGSARIGDARFFFLNAFHDWASGDERTWLVHELERADIEPHLRWRIAVVHQGPWSAGPHGPSGSLVEAHIPELLSAHKVDLVLSGHDHIYDRGSARLKYIVSGGGGAPLYRVLPNDLTQRKAEAAYHFVRITVNADSIATQARRVDGSILDTCGFKKGGPWDCDAPEVAPAPAIDPAQVTMTSASEAPAPPPSPQRCGCAVESGPVPATGFALSVVALVLETARRRRRRSQP